MFVFYQRINMFYVIEYQTNCRNFYKFCNCSNGTKRSIEVKLPFCVES